MFVSFSGLAARHELARPRHSSPGFSGLYHMENVNNFQPNWQMNLRTEAAYTDVIPKPCFKICMFARFSMAGVRTFDLTGGGYCTISDTESSNTTDVKERNIKMPTIYAATFCI
jgi:hypothetical protein